MKKKRRKRIKGGFKHTPANLPDQVNTHISKYDAMLEIYLKGKYVPPEYWCLFQSQGIERPEKVKIRRPATVAQRVAPSTSKPESEKRSERPGQKKRERREWAAEFLSFFVYVTGTAIVTSTLVRLACL
jgi:hypothetical protein